MHPLADARGSARACQRISVIDPTAAVPVGQALGLRRPLRPPAALSTVTLGFRRCPTQCDSCSLTGPNPCEITATVAEPRPSGSGFRQKSPKRLSTAPPPPPPQPA